MVSIAGRRATRTPPRRLRSALVQTSDIGQIVTVLTEHHPLNWANVKQDSNV
jgi:hypothetical protein